jgi:hypothetical protein
MLQAYVSSISGVTDVLFQVFHLDIAKVDLDVAYVAMTKYACCKLMFQVFHVLQTYVANVSFGCFKGKS